MTLPVQFQALPIKNKLLIAFGSIIGLFLLFGIMVLFQVNHYRTYHLPAQENIKALRSDILTMRQAETGFLTTEAAGADNFAFFSDNQSPHAAQMASAYQDFLTQSRELDTYLVRFGNETTRTQLQDLRQRVDVHYDLFETIMTLYQQRGAGEYGVEGELAQLAEELNDTLSDSQSLLLLAQAEQLEKTFVLRKDMASQEAFNEMVESLKAQNPGTSTQELVTRYQDTFNHLAELESEIGRNPDDGLRGTLSTQSTELLAAVDTLEESVSLMTAQGSRFLISSTLVVISLVAILGIGFAILIARLITNPLVELQHGAEQIAAGQFQHRFPQLKSDEIGKLGTALNQMAEKLQHSYLELEHKNQELENNITKLEQTKTATLNILEDLKESQLHIQAEKARDDALLASIGDGVFAVDLNERLILINKAAADIVHVQADQVLGKKYDEVFKFQLEANPEKPYPSFVTTVIKSGQPQTMVNHTVLVKPNGKKIPIADSSAPIKDQKGKVVGCVVVFRDVTQERLVEETKDNFLAVAAHQLRAPLGSMRWNLEMLLDGEMGELPEAVYHRTTLAYHSLLRMIHLVNDLLNVARIDQNSIQETVAPTNPVDIIRAAVSEVQPEASQHYIQLVFKEPSDQIPIIELDPHHLQLVIRHLLSNAIKYNRQGGNVTISVSLQSNHLLFSIADTGIGIPKIEQDHVFTRFFRAKNAMKNATEGSGLGLFVVKSYIEAWGGKIWFLSPTQVENAPMIGQPSTGFGTTFFFTLPLKPHSKTRKTNEESTDLTPDSTTTPSDQQAGSLNQSDQASESPWTTQRIIVADDDEQYGEIFKLKLSAAGFSVEVVRDGEQALTAARDRKPDLMLIDIIMPVKDGFETLKELKADPELRHIKAVAMSNLGQDDDVQKAKALGALGYLIKTNLSVQEMVAAVKKYAQG